MKDLFVGIDTCTRRLNLALVDGRGEILGELCEDVSTHATRLVPGLDILLKDAGAGPEDVAAIGVVIGPGSFTGIRIGIAAALGFSQSQGVPVYPLDSLSALANCCDFEGKGAAILDARRSQVYFKPFSRAAGNLKPVGETVAVSPDEVSELSRDMKWALGDGVHLVKGWSDGCHIIDDIPNTGISAAMYAIESFRTGKRAEAIKPLYVRRPDVRKNL